MQIDLDDMTQKRLIICLVAATVILMGVVIYQSWQLQDIATITQNVLNSVIPLDLALFDHLDCNELRQYEQVFINDSQDQTDISKTLSQALHKKMVGQGC